MAISDRDRPAVLAHHRFCQDRAAFVRSGAAWLITTTFPDWQTNVDCEDGDWRALNFARAI